MSTIRRLLTSFSKGELSPLIEGRPDLAAYFEGGRKIENFNLLRQGGITRRAGLRFIAEVKTSANETIILPFETSVNDSFIIEMGRAYARFFRDKAPILNVGVPVEIVTPYGLNQARDIHFTQSVDVMFLFHENVAQQRLTRASDTVWAMNKIVFKPPPSFEADEGVPGALNTLTPGATTGQGVTFTASNPVFLADGDAGRLIISGASRAVITQVGASAGATGFQSVVIANILDPFPNTDPIPAGTWFLRLSPQATLDPNIKGPIGAQVTLVAGTPTFRASDIGKFIKIFGGLIEINVRDSTTQVKGEIFSILSEATTADPPAVPAGAWTLETNSWEFTPPRTGDFFQGRLAQGGTFDQPTAWWLSVSDDFENYGVAVVADAAVEAVIASRQLNQIEWLIDSGDLFIGTTGAEFRIIGGREEEPIGGDVIPQAKRFDSIGSVHIQPLLIGGQIIFVDRSRKKLVGIGFDLAADAFRSTELTAASEHISGSGFRLGPMAFQKRPDPRIYIIREDGELVTLTFFPAERVVGFTRYVTDGKFESVAVIPSQTALADEVWVVVNRTISGQTKRYIELFETNATELTTRKWKSLQTDSAKVYTFGGVPTTILTGLGHLEGKTVDIVADGSFVGTKVVTTGQITLDAAASINAEVGLHYDSTLETMRPAVPNTVVEGLPRSWTSLWLRLKDTIGGLVNGEHISYPPSPLNTINLFTGDRKVSATGWDTDGAITVKQTEPYPMTVLAIFGRVEFGDND